MSNITNASFQTVSKCTLQFLMVQPMTRDHKTYPQKNSINCFKPLIFCNRLISEIEINVIKYKNSIDLLNKPLQKCISIF